MCADSHISYSVVYLFPKSQFISRKLPGLDAFDAVDINYDVSVCLAKVLLTAYKLVLQPTFQRQATSHLSKGPSDLKQKCTQLPTPSSGTDFIALSLGVIDSVRSVSLRNQFLIG